MGGEVEDEDGESRAQRAMCHRVNRHDVGSMVVDA